MSKLEPKSLPCNERGATLFELLTMLSLIGILSGIALSNIRTMTKPLTNAVVSTEQFLQLVRSRAISGTEIYKVQPSGSTEIHVFRGSTCAGSTTPVSDLTLELPAGSRLLDTSWFVCFNARGRADASIAFDLSDHDSRTKTIRIALGGGIRIDG